MDNKEIKTKIKLANDGLAEHEKALFCDARPQSYKPLGKYVEIFELGKGKFFMDIRLWNWLRSY